LGFLLIARQASASLPGVRQRIPGAPRIAVFAMCGPCFSHPGPEWAMIILSLRQIMRSRPATDNHRVVAGQHASSRAHLLIG